MAVLLQMTANINRDTKTRPYPFELDEVLGWLGYAPEPDASEPTPAQPTPDELRERLQLMAQMYPQPNGQQREGGER